jgi:hypothetical protein
VVLPKCLPEDLPGYFLSSRREYLYLQREEGADFHDQFSRIGHGYEGDLPSSGGLMNEEASIRVNQEGLVLDLRGVSFRGDTRNWRRVLESYCKRNSLLFGTIGEDGIALSNGVHLTWLECQTFCDRPSSGADA